MTSGDEPGSLWSAGAVAAMLGVSPATLRTWDHRYGLGPSQRETGRHRRYDAADITRLRGMLTLTGQGITPAAAAAIVLRRPTPHPRRAGGGRRIVPARAGGARTRGFARAAARLDGPLLTRLAADLVSQFGVTTAWEAHLAPYLIEVGEQTATGALGVEVEHVVSASIIEALRAVPAPAEHGRLPALLACAPEEQHWLPLAALTAGLAERDCPSRGLGARVPADALLEAVHRLDPLVVVVWAHTARMAKAAPVAELGARGVVAAGPGWAKLALPGHARRPGSLSEAIETILDLVAPKHPTRSTPAHHTADH